MCKRRASASTARAAAHSGSTTWLYPLACFAATSWLCAAAGRNLWKASMSSSLGCSTSCDSDTRSGMSLLPLSYATKARMSLVNFLGSSDSRALCRKSKLSLGGAWGSCVGSCVGLCLGAGLSGCVAIAPPPFPTPRPSPLAPRF